MRENNPQSVKNNLNADTLPITERAIEVHCHGRRNKTTIKVAFVSSAPSRDPSLAHGGQSFRLYFSSLTFVVPAGVREQNVASGPFLCVLFFGTSACFVPAVSRVNGDVLCGCLVSDSERASEEGETWMAYSRGKGTRGGRRIVFIHASRTARTAPDRA